MPLKLKEFHIPQKPYITKKLDHETLSKLLDASFFVIDGIYLIKNGLDLNIKLFEEEQVGDYKLSAYVKVDYAYAAGARAQVMNIKPFKKLARRRPAFKLRISLYNEEQMAVYSFTQKYTRINQLIDQISQQHQILNALIDKYNLETK